jgi:hypothetical protein
MNIPGFTAEASLSKGERLYYTAGEALLEAAVVQPAQSDVFYPNRPPLALLQPCFKLVCPEIITRWGDRIHYPCHWVFGYC